MKEIDNSGSEIFPLREPIAGVKHHGKPGASAMLAKALPEMYLEHTDLYRKEPEYMGVESLAESGMTLRFTIPVKEVNIFRARRQFNRDLRILFAENGVEIPFPQVDVHQR